MELKKVETIKGYVAFTKDGKKFLRNFWSGGSQTGTNKQSLSDDIDKIGIVDSKEEVEMIINWFNRSHVNQVEFDIKEVEFTITKNIEIK